MKENNFGHDEDEDDGEFRIPSSKAKKSNGYQTQRGRREGKVTLESDIDKGKLKTLKTSRNNRQSIEFYEQDKRNCERTESELGNDLERISELDDLLD